MSAPLSVPTFLVKHLQDEILYPEQDAFTLWELARGLVAGIAVIRLKKKNHWATIIYYDPTEVSVRPEYFQTTTPGGIGSHWGTINGVWQHLVLSDEDGREAGLAFLYDDLRSKKAFSAGKVFFTLRDSREKFNKYPELIDI